MRWKLLFASFFFAAGLALAGFSEYCFSRSGSSPVSIPIVVSPNHITRKFLASASAHYRIGVAFDNPEKLVFAAPDCVAGPYDTADKCSGIPARFKASWTLSRGSRIIQHGSASETIWRGSGPPFLGFGGFQSEAWQWYQLDVADISYDTKLAQANPRLTVGIWTEKSFFYESKFLAVKLTARITCGLCFFIGGLLILSSLVARREALFAPWR
jgi:hypothetical protein